jgi:hypothetical protein
LAYCTGATSAGVYGGDHGDIRVHDIDGVQPAPQAHFEHRHVEVGAGKKVERGQRAVLEVGQGHRRRLPRAARHFDALEGSHQRSVAGIDALDPDTLVVPAQVR